jgi:hypothetical protein
MAHRKRVSAYRRQGVSAFAYLHKLTSANRSRFTFCFRQNAKSKNFMAGVGAWGKRVGVSADRRIGERSLEDALAISGSRCAIEHRVNLLAARNVSDFSTRSPFQKNESERLAYAGTFLRYTPTSSPSLQRRHAHTPSRRPVSPPPIRFS